MKVRRYILFVFAVVLAAAPASAQRTMPGQSFVDLRGTFPIGGGVSYGQYLVSSYWKAGVGTMRQREYLRVDGIVGETPLDVWQAKAEGDFMYRLVSTRSRIFSIYGGGGLWLGAEKVDPFRTLPSDVIVDLDGQYRFIFGATPRLELEFFIGNHVAVLVGGRLPCAVFSQIRVVTLQADAGLRVAF